MKTNTVSSLRTAALASLLLLLPLTTSAKGSTTDDLALQLLTRHGTVPVKAAGPYVEVGTYRIQVSVKLGRPTHQLPDGTWLYDGSPIEGSDARGTLVVRFNQGRVSSLVLATPAVVAALRTAPKPAVRVANHDPR